MSLRSYTAPAMSLSAPSAAVGRRRRVLLVHANPFQRVTPVPAYGLERLRTAAEEAGAEVQLLDQYLVSEDPLGAAREADDLPCARRERQRAEDEEADDVGRDHHPPAREAVDERADREADRDCGQEVGDQERRDPRSGVREVPDLEVERDERHPAPEAGAECREEEQAEPAHSAEQVGLPPEETVHDSGKHAGHGCCGG